MPGERRNSSAGSDDSSRGTLENQRTRPTPVIDDNPQARNEWFLRSRSDADGQVLRGVYLEASRKRHRIQHGAPEAGTPGPPGTVNWTPLGPSVVSGGFVESGRVTTVTVGPSGTRVYAGAANGGVWLSGDGGATWSPIDDYVVSPSLTGGAAQADSLAIGALAVSFGPSAAGDELYVGTGDPNASYDAYLGIGIRHLTGGSWSLEATNLVNCGIFDIVIDPDDATMVLTATTKGLYRRPTSGSMDTWSLVTSPAFTNGSGAASALIVAGSGTGKTYYLAFESDNVYSSPDAINWTALSGLSGSGRIALAAGESDPLSVYALRQDATLNRLNGGAFTVVPGLPIAALFPGNQGWYDMIIGVDPADGDTIYLGGDRLSLFRGTLTGTPENWVFPFNAANSANPTADPTWVGSGIHADVHAFAFGLNAAGTAHDGTNVWIGSDGGLFQSTGAGAAGTFKARNIGLAITEFSYVAQRIDTSSVLFAGAQDNGTPRLLSEEASLETAGGDGGGVTFDPTSPYRVLRQYVHCYLDVSEDGGATWSGTGFPAPGGQPECGITGFVAPLASIASGPSSALAAFGTNRLWLSSDWGNSWVTLPSDTNPYAQTPPDLNQDVLDGNAITAIAFASATEVFAATASTVWHYSQGGGGWSKTVIPATGLPPAYYITSLASDPSAPGSFYATMGGGGLPHVYYFDGSSWQAAMPLSVVDVPTSAVVVDPSNPQFVYAGTDVGCWKGEKTGSGWTWTLFSAGLPESAVTDLIIHDPARLLRAATHGRGVWEIDLDATSGLDPDVYLRANYNDDGRIKNGSRQPWVEARQDPTHADAANPYILYHWMSADIKVRRTSLAGLPVLGSPVTFLDFAVNIGDYVDSTLHIETADASGIDRIFVEVHNRSLTALPGAQVQVLLLVADASAGLPALPAGYATQINAGNTSNSWLAGTPWGFVDPSTPYRTLPGSLEARTPQVVEFDLDFSSLGLAAGHDHVCLAAFVTTPSDQLTGTDTDLDQLAMTDKHVAQRNTHLVLAGATPGTAPGQQRHRPQTVIIDFHNPGALLRNIDIVFDRNHFPGSLSAMLPKAEFLTGSPSPAGMRVQEHGTDGEYVRQWLGDLLERLGARFGELGQAMEGVWEPDPQDHHRPRMLRKLAGLDRSRTYEAEANAARPTISGLALPPGSSITAAVTIEAPAEARPGDQYRLDVIQYEGQRIVGGSTYVIAIVED